MLGLPFEVVAGPVCRSSTNNPQKEAEEGGGGEEEMVRLVCLYIQHNIGKTTYSAP